MKSLDPLARRRVVRRLALAVLFVVGGCGGGGEHASTAAPAAAPVVPVVATTPAPALAAASSSVAAADAFVDSAGVNVHLSYGETAYGNASLVVGLLGRLGVRHVRDGLVLGQPNLCAAARQLAATGVRLATIAGLTQKPADYDAWVACAGSAIEAWEGPNEPDVSGGASWAADARRVQSGLFAYAHARGQLVFSPAATSAAAYAALAPLAAMATNANMHDYLAGRNPGTPGWGDVDAFGRYGSLPWQIGAAQQATGALPVVATETGYADSPADTHWLPAAVKARYTLRTLLEHFNAGVPRTYLYELVDEGGAPYSSYGLVDATGTPKPAFTALANLLGHLADPGPPFTAVPLAYTFTAPANVHRLLLQRRSGAYMLVLWLEAQEWDPDAHLPLSVAPASVSVALPALPSSLRTFTLDDAGNAMTSPRSPATTVSLTVGTAPLVLDVTP